MGIEPSGTNEILETALLLISEGISVIPVWRSKDKTKDKTPVAELLPATHDGKPSWRPYQERLPDEATVRRWFTLPRHNLAIVCGKVSGNLVCIDFDTKAAARSWGQPRASLLAGAPVEKTGRKGGGWHLYIRVDRPVNGTKGAGFDVKAEGGYVVCAPSVHGGTGSQYKLVRGDMVKIPVFEVETLNLDTLGANGKGKSLGWEIPLLEDVPEGERNNRLTQLCGRWIAKRLGEEEVLRLALATNGGWRKPLSEGEVRSVVASMVKTDKRKHFAAPDPEGGAVKDVEVDQLDLTDMGNGFRFARDNGEDLRYCTMLDDGRGGGWLHFDGTRWVRDHNQVVQGLAKNTIKNLYIEAWPTKNKRLAKHALSSASNSRIQAMLAQARSVPGIPITPEQLDVDQWILNVQNGTIDLRTKEIHPHRKEDVITKIAAVEFDPSTECPRWMIFLDEIMAGDQEMVRFLQRLMGYCLTGDMREDEYFVLWGKGANGKSTLVETILSVMGDYACAAAERTFMLEHAERINADLARIWDKRLIFTSEINRGQKLNESLIKRWTSQDTLTVEAKYQNPWDTKPVGKLIFRTNYKPRITGQDDGIWRRTKLVPFTQKFEGASDDKQLKVKLLCEGSGILNWLLEGCRMWQEEGLELPDKVKQASTEYRGEQDTLGEFFAEYLEKCDSSYKIQKRRAYELYKAHAETTGERVMGKIEFGRKLSEYPGIEDGRDTTGSDRIWIGIRERRPDGF